MIHSTNPSACRSRRSTRGTHAEVRLPVLLAVVLALAVGFTLAYVVARKKAGGTAGEGGEPVLSEATRTALKDLRTPVQLRFHALVDPATTPPALPAFAERVGQLLSLYEREGNGRITVQRSTTASPDAFNAALRDGVKAVHFGSGEPCYLGIAVVAARGQEVLPQLSPEWESAVEPDLTRAILRAASATAPPAPGPEAARAEADALASINRTFPDPASVSLEAGTAKLRELAIQEFQTATKESAARIEEARQKLQAALDSNSPDVDTLRRQLQEAQIQGSRQLQQVGAESQARMQAWQKLKDTASPGNPAGQSRPPNTRPGR